MIAPWRCNRLVERFFIRKHNGNVNKRNEGGETLEDFQNSFDMIYHAGNGKDELLKALHCAQEKDDEACKEHLKLAQIEINTAHSFHSSYLQELANGKSVQPDLIMMHAQDHLNSTMTIQILVTELIHMIQGGDLR